MDFHLGAQVTPSAHPDANQDRSFWERHCVPRYAVLCLAALTRPSASEAKSSRVGQSLYATSAWVSHDLIGTTFMGR
jgi:hypothetical protein